MHEFLCASSTTANPSANGNATCCCSAGLQQLQREEGALRAAAKETATADNLVDEWKGGGAGAGAEGRACWGPGQGRCCCAQQGTAAGYAGTGRTRNCCSPPRRARLNISAVHNPAAVRTRLDPVIAVSPMSPKLRAA